MYELQCEFVVRCVIIVIEDDVELGVAWNKVGVSRRQWLSVE